MSGHNKWSTIKHKKGAADAKRGRLFSRLIKEIAVAARMGGGDPDGNPRLRSAVSAARAANMPKENIERAIKRGSGGLDGAQYEEFVYEGYGPGGVAVMLEVLTDNKNRTVAEVRHIFDKFNGSLGESGCVSWMFDKRGVIEISAANLDEDEVMEVAIEAGADDVRRDGETYEIRTAPQDLETVRAAFAAKGWNIELAEITMIPKDTVKLEGKKAEAMLKMMDALDDNEDLQKVYANFDISEEEMIKASA
ncbi:MAG: YebC/PmpR family DNA-binding transcriptional regulator [Desulfomonile sp.]|nr:YebC/PmpR family DNA-binding transcriptional regulator [Desulfomonile sp.]